MFNKYAPGSKDLLVMPPWPPPGGISIEQQLLATLMKSRRSAQ